jgi:hypothetical protein
MNPEIMTYPIFEANQVLTSDHLNNVFSYLDEQERLTRANLIGIGILCGLDVYLDGTTIQLSKGGGITSEGYLIVEPANVVFVSYKEYILPKEIDYPPFKYLDGENKPQQYQLWELISGEGGDSTKLDTPPDFLKDKAVLLFLELKKESLRNCTPNNCNDKGNEVTATVKRLLIKVDDLNKIVDKPNKQQEGPTFAEFESVLSGQLGLIDLRLPRYDTPSTNPVKSDNVLTAFGSIFRDVQLVTNTAKALSAAYEVFKPLLQDVYPEDPFTSKQVDFIAKFGFLDTAASEEEQVKFLQYYYDFFDDLLRAYYEFRWSSINMLCACCPPSNLFPRHLTLGVPTRTGESISQVNRQHFLASPIKGTCKDQAKDLEQLFRRMVEMCKTFTNTPIPPMTISEAHIDHHIRITPSKLGDVPLGDKSIPYYYRQNGNPPLFKLWNIDLSRRDRADQNLSYRSDEYKKQSTPAFVTDALRYDLELYNFLRIEGHLGKNYTEVLYTLGELKKLYRLPIEIVALRTGAFDENITQELNTEECRFQDLETLYKALSAELICFLCGEVQYFYNLPDQVASPIREKVKPSIKEEGKPQLPLLKQCAPDFLVQPETFGRRFEDLLTLLKNDSEELSLDNSLELISKLLSIQTDYPSNRLIKLIFLIWKLFAQLKPSLGQFNFVEFEKSYRDLVDETQKFEEEREEEIQRLQENTELLDWEEFDDRLEAIIYSCHLETFSALQEEYKRRSKEIIQKRYLSEFLKQHPGIQHKAGVPLGGTFIIVYHHSSCSVKAPSGLRVDDGSINRMAISTESVMTLSGALNQLQDKEEFAKDPKFQHMIAELNRQIPTISQTLSEFKEGEVIADFYLPYLCCSPCPPTQYVIPKAPPTFSVKIGCTDQENQADMIVKPEGGQPPYTYRLDEPEPFQELPPVLKVPVGRYGLVIRDSAGVESAPQLLTIPAPLIIGKEDNIDDVQNNTYQVSFDIKGGTPPYHTEHGMIEDSKYTSEPVTSGESVTVKITDNANCEVSTTFTHTICTLPNKGKAIRCGHLFWLPKPTPERKLKSYEATIETFYLIDHEGSEIDLDELPDIKATVGNLNNKFEKTVKGWLEKINSVVEGKLKNKDWFRLDYRRNDEGALEPLIIECFEGVTFKIVVNNTFTFGNINEQRTLTYTEQGTDIEINGAEPFHIPNFGCEKTNKCLSGQGWLPVCTEADIQLATDISFDGNEVNLTAGNRGEEQDIQYLWEVEDAVPSLLSGKDVTTRIVVDPPAKKKVRLTAFSETGCTVTQEAFIETNG